MAESPFPIAPSPWDDLEADVFSAVGWASAANGLPTGSYSPLEENSSFADPEINGKFVGGLCSVMILRYHQTPVGPYDEVIWVPGSFEVPQLENAHMVRIGRIYVSSLESTFNARVNPVLTDIGRRNWNIPKQVANFTFHPSDTQNPPYKKIEVSLPDSSQPFISIDLTPISLLSRPTIPVSTFYLPLNLDLGMPALPQSPNWTKDAQVGTEKWCAARATISGWLGMVRAQGQIGNADGEGFPRLMMDGNWAWLRRAKVVFENVDADYQ